MPKPEPSNPASKGPLIDNPINDSQEDFLEVDGFAQHLEDLLMSATRLVTIGIPLAIGVSRKDQPNLTSLEQILSPVIYRAARINGAPHIYVNTWQHAQFKQEEWLGILILNGIVDKLHETFPEKQTQKSMP